MAELHKAMGAAHGDLAMGDKGGSPIERVRHHWESETTGIRYGEGASRNEFYQKIEAARYRLERYIHPFAQFAHYEEQRVLEIGIGAGVDFSQFVRGGAQATGVDLTRAAIDHTSGLLGQREVDGATFHLSLANAERLPFRESVFDLVYSWGVLHHTPDAERALKEALRVLRARRTTQGHVLSCRILDMLAAVASVRPLVDASPGRTWRMRLRASRKSRDQGVNGEGAGRDVA